MALITNNRKKRLNSFETFFHATHFTTGKIFINFRNKRYKITLISRLRIFSLVENLTNLRVPVSLGIVLLLDREYNYYNVKAIDYG